MSGPDPRDLVGEEWEPEWLRSAGEGTYDPQDLISLDASPDDYEAWIEKMERERFG